MSPCANKPASRSALTRHPRIAGAAEIEMAGLLGAIEKASDAVALTRHPRSQIDIPPHPHENKANRPRNSRPRAPVHATLMAEMVHTTPPLTTVQQCVADALAAGSTLCDAAKQYRVHRVTVYRWMKTSRPFTDALHRARAEFVLARRDDLHKLSNLAVEILFKILENPKSSPAVLLRTAMFILQRPQHPKTGWTMPEPAPDPDGNKLLDSAIIEQDYDSLPGLANVERDFESATSEPPPPPESPSSPPANATGRNQMQHNSQNSDDVAPPAVPQSGLRSCPVPPGVLQSPLRSAEIPRPTQHGPFNGTNTHPGNRKQRSPRGRRSK